MAKFYTKTEEGKPDEIWFTHEIDGSHTFDGRAMPEHCAQFLPEYNAFIEGLSKPLKKEKAVKVQDKNKDKKKGKNK